MDYPDVEQKILILRPLTGGARPALTIKTITIHLELTHFKLLFCGGFLHDYITCDWTFLAFERPHEARREGLSLVMTGLHLRRLRVVFCHRFHGLDFNIFEIVF
jgi:hypothetical protein